MQTIFKAIQNLLVELSFANGPAPEFRQRFMAEYEKMG